MIGGHILDPGDEQMLLYLIIPIYGGGEGGLPTEQRFQKGVLGAELQELSGRCRGGRASFVFW